MEKQIVANGLFKVFKYLMCVLLLLLLALNTVSALNCENPADETEKLICQIKTHLPQPQNDPRLNELRGLPTTEWCIYCHTKGRHNP